MSELTQNKMGTAPVGRLLLTMSVPVDSFHAGTGAVQHCGQYFWSQKISPDALTAVSLAFPVQTLMIAVGVGHCGGRQFADFAPLGRGAF